MNPTYAHLSDEAWFDEVSGKNGPALFGLPEDRIQTGTVGRAGSDILRDAFTFQQFTKKMLLEHGNGLSDSTDVMDFGCAWGRILRFWLRDLPPERVHGYEVQDWLLAFAQRDVPATYKVTNTWPPLPDGSPKFDLIYAYSVFSHLPANLSDAWVREFAKALKPGGIVCLTTRPRAHIEVAGTSAVKGQAFADLYADLFKDKDDALAAYDKGEYIFYPAAAGELKAETYGEAVIPAEYVKRNWTSDLEFCGVYDRYSPTYMQPCFVLRKPR